MGDGARGGRGIEKHVVLLSVALASARHGVTVT